MSGSGLQLPDAPEGVLSKTALTAYRTLAFVVGLLIVGGLGGAFLVLALHSNASAAVVTAAPSPIATDDIERLEHKIEKVDDRVRELQSSFAALEQHMKDREERRR